MDAGQAAVTAYFVCLSLLALLGVHRLFLVTLYLRSRGAAPGPCPSSAEWPIVTVQLPIFNERYVIDRLLDAVAALEYPRDRLEIQLLDDSTDATWERVGRRVAELRDRGFDVLHLRRADRTGFKAGALAAGLARARGTLVCVFDADFQPRPDFLRRIVPRFADERLGMVQARWDHLNRDHSLLTRVQALYLDAHFAIEQAARNRTGRFFNFNGTAGVWRRRAIEQAGGWEHDTLTEDLDLSYRAQLAGWRFLYVDEPAAPAELPATLAAFRSQQRRWTRGAVQTARKLLPALWRSDHPRRVKIEGTFHMTANVAYPLMVALSGLAFPALLARRALTGPAGLGLDVAILLGATGSVCVFFLVAQAAVGRSWLRAVPLLPALMALGAGISISNGAAVLGGLRGGPGEFVRTPKYALARAGDSWRQRSYRSSPGRLLGVEAAAALYYLVVTVVAVRLGMMTSLPLLLLFLTGYAWVAGMSVAEAWDRPAPRRRPT